MEYFILPHPEFSVDSALSQVTDNSRGPIFMRRNGIDNKAKSIRITGLCQKLLGFIRIVSIGRKLWIDMLFIIEQRPGKNDSFSP